MGREPAPPLTPEVVEARIACRVAELRVLAAQTSILAARAYHIPSDIRFGGAAKSEFARESELSIRNLELRCDRLGRRPGDAPKSEFAHESECSIGKPVGRVGRGRDRNHHQHLRQPHAPRPDAVRFCNGSHWNPANHDKGAEFRYWLQLLKPRSVEVVSPESTSECGPRLKVSRSSGHKAFNYLGR